jgi:hypothetical protein
MTTRTVTSVIAALVAATSIAVLATPAEAQYRRHRNNNGAAIAAGVGIGILSLGAAVAAQRRYDEPAYYDDGPRYYRRAPAYYYPSEPVYREERYIEPRRVYRPSRSRDIYVDPYTGRETRLLR